jgi:UPF0716 family protein affecting phage T7 exclusion
MTRLHANSIHISLFFFLTSFLTSFLSLFLFLPFSTAVAPRDLLVHKVRTDGSEQAALVVSETRDVTNTGKPCRSDLQALP